MRSVRFAVTLAAASLLVAASVGVASAAPSVKVATRGLEQRIAASYTSQPAVPIQGVTYVDVNVDGYAWFALQAGSGYAATGRLMAANTWMSYAEYHYDGAVRHVTFYSTGSSAAVPAVDMALAYGAASVSVPWVGTISVGCVGYGGLLRSSWTWTGGYTPNDGWTQTGVGQRRACVPSFSKNGLPMSATYSSGSIGSFQGTQVAVYPG
jgi:hypothetical protein